MALISPFIFCPQLPSCKIPAAFLISTSSHTFLVASCTWGLRGLTIALPTRYGDSVLRMTFEPEDDHPGKVESIGGLRLKRTGEEIRERTGLLPNGGEG